MKHKGMTRKKLPQKLYVVVDGGSSSNYVAEVDFQDFPASMDGEKVGVYERVDLKVLKARKELE